MFGLSCGLSPSCSNTALNGVVASTRTAAGLFSVIGIRTIQAKNIEIRLIANNLFIVVQNNKNDKFQTYMGLNTLYLTSDVFNTRH
jgi:hypothetical protein